MTPQEAREVLAARETIAELMKRYDFLRGKWIEAHGNDEGFDDWFTVAFGNSIARVSE